MRQGWLGGIKRKCAIVLVVFGRGGIAVDKLHRVDIVGLGEEIRWLGDLLELNFCNLMHMLELLDIALNLRFVGRALGQVFRQLGIIWVAITLYRTGRQHGITVRVGV